MTSSFLPPLQAGGRGCRFSYHALDLEKPAQPPYLEDGLANDHANDKQVPPLNSAVGALGRVPVGALAKNIIRLLVFDLVKQVGELADCNRRGGEGRDVSRGETGATR